MGTTHVHPITLRRSTLVTLLAAGVLFAALTAWVTWPLAQDPWRTALDQLKYYGGGGRIMRANTYLDLWILSWVTHALGTDPAGLFDANVFHPARFALAYREHLIGLLPIFAPLYVVTGNPVFAKQISLLASFALSGLAMFALLRRWTKDELAALVGGVIFAFAPWRLSELGHMHLLIVYYLPLLLLFADRFFEGGRTRDLLAFTAALALQMLASYYLAYQAVAAAVATLAAAWWARRGAVPTARYAAVAGAIAVAGVGLAVVSVPYLRLAQSGATPDPTDAGILSAGSLSTWKAYLWRDVPRFVSVNPFVGPVVVGLAAAAWLPARSRPAIAPVWGRWVLLLLVVAGHAVALGPLTWTLAGFSVPAPYQVLSTIVPGFWAMRMPLRFVFLVSFASSGLAGLGLARINGYLRWPPLRALAAGVVLIGLWRAYVPPVDLPVVTVPVGNEIPPVYRWLGEHGEGAPVLEIPFRGGLGYFETRYAYFSTYHWLPLLNGPSGHAAPPSVAVVSALLDQIPDRAALESLVRMTGLRWVLLHRDPFPGKEARRWMLLQGDPGVRVAGEFGTDLLLELGLPVSAEWQSRLAWSGNPETTFAGTALAPLPRPAGSVNLRVLSAPRMLWPRQLGELRVQFENPGPLPWPGVAVDPSRLVVLSGTWEREDGSPGPRPVTVRLANDVPVGESVTLRVPLQAPRRESAYYLSLALAQQDVGPIGDPVRVRIDVRPPPRRSGGPAGAGP